MATALTVTPAHLGLNPTIMPDVKIQNMLVKKHLKLSGQEGQEAQMLSKAHMMSHMLGAPTGARLAMRFSLKLPEPQFPCL